MASAEYKPQPVVREIRQSPPMDLEVPYEASWVKGKTIVITGGASGFGAAFTRKWASEGATIIIGDISVSRAEDLVREVRATTKNPNVHSLYCNVADWKSQVNMFKEAVKLSPHGGIDTVVANAGVAGLDEFEEPKDLDSEDPPKPNLTTIEVNLIGVLYTAHLALFYLARNPGSSAAKPTSDPQTQTRDRHLLLMGSMASLGPIPGQPLYAAAKHGVLGLFRTLRSTSFFHGIRVNLLCPYFIDTPILPAPARALLAGGGLGKQEDVVAAGTRFTADTRIVGRSLYVGPKMNIVEDERGEPQLALKLHKEKGREVAIWEAYAQDYDDSELFGRKIIRLLNHVSVLRGWSGLFIDLWRSLVFGVRAGRRTFFGSNKQPRK